MASRVELQELLESILGSRNVYYQKPSTGIQYPAILYNKSGVRKTAANNTSYLYNTRYEITVIDKKPDNPAVQKILDLPCSSYDRPYRADNLYHDVLTLYY